MNQNDSPNDDDSPLQRYDGAVETSRGQAFSLDAFINNLDSAILAAQSDDPSKLSETLEQLKERIANYTKRNL